MAVAKQAGYIKLWRAMRDSKIWHLGPRYRGLFCDLLLSVQWEKTEGRFYILEPGQMETSNRELADKVFGVSTSEVSTILDQFKKVGAIDFETVSGKCTVISIINWRRYQGG